MRVLHSRIVAVSRVYCHIESMYNLVDQLNIQATLLIPHMYDQLALQALQLWETGEFGLFLKHCHNEYPD